MARPERRNADYFPLWKPQRATIQKIKSYKLKVRMEALKNSSSAFIKNKEVREIIFREGKNKCVFYGSKNDLTIDHIVSIYQAAIGKFPIEKLNTRENLQLLCGSCNSRKAP